MNCVFSIFERRCGRLWIAACAALLLFAVAGCSDDESVCPTCPDRPAWSKSTFFAVGYVESSEPNAYLYGVRQDGVILWEKSLELQNPVLNMDFSADRNVTEESFYLGVLGEANRVSGQGPVRKYNMDGELVWEALLGPDVYSVSANPVLGGAYVSDQSLGVYRLDSSGALSGARKISAIRGTVPTGSLPPT